MCKSQWAVPRVVISPVLAFTELFPSGIRLDGDGETTNESAERRLMSRKELLCSARSPNNTPRRGASLWGINYLLYAIKLTLVTCMKLLHARVKVIVLFCNPFFLLTIIEFGQLWFIALWKLTKIILEIWNRLNCCPQIKTLNVS